MNATYSHWIPLDEVWLFLRDGRMDRGWQQWYLTAHELGAYAPSEWYKNGNLKYLRKSPLTLLDECELCGFRSTKKRVSCRYDIWGWNREHKNDHAAKPIATLCTGCWNKIRALEKRAKLAEQNIELIRELNKLTRKANGKEHSNIGAVA